MGDEAQLLIHGQLPGELEEWCRRRGHPVYRLRQLWRWLYVQRATEWERMGNLPSSFRRDLARDFIARPCEFEEAQADPSGTCKVLLRLRDGHRIESVVLPGGARVTLCLSTQVGCKFGCAFCASGQGGFVRNLEAGEIVGQVLWGIERIGRKPENIVFMGMGEPLDNYEAVQRSLRLLNDSEGLAFGARRITVSTCGVVPGIRRLAEEGLQVELSVSLHAAEDALRSRLMPVNRRYPLEELLAACADYTAKTDRIITFEYTLIRGVNDSREAADRLAERVRPVRGRVNLIPLSPVEEFNGRGPETRTTTAFLRILQEKGINATLRLSKGSRIRAACGQLRRRAGGASGRGP